MVKSHVENGVETFVLHMGALGAFSIRGLVTDRTILPIRVAGWGKATMALPKHYTDEMATTVVNIHAGAYDVYIGRPGKGLNGYFGNPHPVYITGKPWTECKICKCRHTRDEAIQAYMSDFQRRLQSEPAFRARVEELRGKRLGCFCRPAKGFGGELLCHGQIIAGHLDGKRPEEVE